ncbi:MAG: threonine--tRNA ligase [Paracoccaceae bacterium]
MAQISLTFPDGNAKLFEAGVTAAEIAAGISSSLAKKAISASVNGKHYDLQWPITEDAEIAIHTMKDEAQALELVRHDAAHIMARAVQELWPGVKVTIGPVIDNGWYYDFDRDEPFTPEDLGEIEAKMKEIINRRDPVTTEVWDRARAIKYYEANNEPYKVELVEAIPGKEPIRMYWHGHWQDLCRGPHLQHTGQIPADAFKLMKVAGAYWRGDSNRPMLQRIYGVGFLNRDGLKQYLNFLEEAEKRDHRRLGREMDLFHLQEEAPGQIFWHPNGWRIYTTLQDYMRRQQEAGGYVEVNTPQVIDRKLWEASGHWEKYQENMFIVEVDEEHAREKTVNALKPMNCPGHVQVFNQGLKSYRDLPLRIAEFGSCNRYEPSGALHGIMRVRGFTQDDAHIFCTEAQIEAETKRFIDFLARIYADLGFDKWSIKLSTRPDKRIGTDAEWDRVEAASAPPATTRATSSRSSPAKAPSTGRSSNSCSPTRSAATGNAARCRSTLPARTAGRQLYRRGRSQAPALHAAPGDAGQLRALHRHPDRGTRRPAAVLDRAAPGGGGLDRLGRRRFRPGGGGGAEGAGRARRGRHPQRRSTTRSASIPWARCR